MDFLSVFATFCAALTLMFAHCASDHQLLPLHHIQVRDRVMLRASPMRLKLINRVELTPKSLTLKDDDVPKEKLLMEEASSGDDRLHKQFEKREKVMNAGKNKGRDGVGERPLESEYFGMDYGWVRRRRPIHNMGIPFVP